MYVDDRSSLGYQTASSTPVTSSISSDLVTNYTNPVLDKPQRKLNLEGLVEKRTMNFDYIRKFQKQGGYWLNCILFTKKKRKKF